MGNIYPFKGFIQHYAWGGKYFLPNLLEIANPEEKPFAELWMGAHHRGEGKIQKTEEEILLGEWILQKPVEILGASTAKQFDNQLPFLFKVLAVRKMLSIQSHPTKAQAIKGYTKENERGIPLTAFNRNFKDNNHKPEVMVALTDFWLLHGFRSVKAIEYILNTEPAFVALQPYFKEHSTFQLYRHIMEIPQAAVNRVLQPLAERLEKLSIDELDMDKADYWAKLAFRDYTKENGDYDRGIFSIYFFNLVKLKKGEGIYQAAGIPHAYLEGVNVELMANSDNVFRGGLTPKHVDVPELLQHLVFESVVPKVLYGEAISTTEKVYRTPAPDFELREIQLNKNQIHENSAEASAAILIVMEGAVNVKHENQAFTRKRGEIFFVEAGSDYILNTLDTTALLYKAIVP